MREKHSRGGTIAQIKRRNRVCQGLQLRRALIGCSRRTSKTAFPMAKHIQLLILKPYANKVDFNIFVVDGSTAEMLHQ